MGMFNINPNKPTSEEIAKQEALKKEQEEKEKMAAELAALKAEQKRMEEEKKAEEERKKRELAEKIAKEKAEKEERERREAEALEQQRLEQDRIRQQQEMERAQQIANGKNKKNKKVKNDKIKSNKNPDNLSTEERLDKMYKSLKYKKIGFLAIIIIISLALIIFGTYNTFFREEKSTAQLAGEINAINQDTAFPDYGVQGFLQQNIEALLKDNVFFAEGTGSSTYKVDPNDLYVTAITKKTANIANVFFNCKISTNISESWHSFYLPVKFDFQAFRYSPAGPLELAMRGIENTTNISDNPINSFEGIAVAPDTEIAEAKTFVDNFLKALYNSNIDISQMYKGNYRLGDPNITYISITEFALYQGNNPMGYNSMVKYVVQTKSGLRYSNRSFLKLARSDKTWIINEVL